MILTFLFGSIALLTLFQPNIRRKFAAFIFISVAIIHDLIPLDYPIYYLTAAIANLLVIIITSSITPIPKMVIRMQRICLGFIAVNGFGILSHALPWIEWFHGHGAGNSSISVLVYNNTMIVLYCLTLLNFVDMTLDERERSNFLDIRRHLRFNFRSLFYCLSGNGDKI